MGHWVLIDMIAIIIGSGYAVYLKVKAERDGREDGE